MDTQTAKDNARELDVYLEVLVPMFEPGGGIPEIPINRKERGSSRSPLSDYVMAVMNRNIHASRINRVLELASYGPDGQVKVRGKEIWKILSVCLHDHTAIRRWKDDPTCLQYKRYKDMLLTLAFILSDEYDNPEPYRIKVWVNAEHVQERQKTRDALKVTTFYTRCQMVEQLEEIEESLGQRGQLAMEILSERKRKEGKDWSVTKIKRAREVVNKHRKEVVA